MPPRKKPQADPAQTDIEQAIAETPPLVDPTWKADALIKRELELSDYVAAQTKAFGEFCKPFREEIDAIRGRLLAMLIEQKTDSFKTEFGTAYKSEIMNQKLDVAAPPYIEAPAYTEDGITVPARTYTGREALLYWALDNWDKYGNEGLTVGVPIATVKQVMEDTGGHPPPGITVSFFTRVNIKRG